MSFCKYCNVGDYYGFCTCDKIGDTCPWVRRCPTHHQWLPLNSMDDCVRRQAPTRKPKEDIELKDGEYYVASIQGKKMYVDVNGYLVRMANPYDYEPDKVKLVEVDGEMYIEEFAPKKAQEKKEEVLAEVEEKQPKEQPKKKNKKSKKGE